MPVFIKKIFTIFMILLLTILTHQCLAQSVTSCSVSELNRINVQNSNIRAHDSTRVFLLQGNGKTKSNFTDKRRIHYNRLIFSTAALVTLNWASYQPFKEAWWEEERTHFHLYRGWRRTQGWWDFGWNDTLYGHVDKLGHFYCSRILSDQLTYLSRWIGFSERSCQLIGPILSSLLMLEIEIYDGFFKEWGFSLADFTANELGAFMPLIEKKAPFLQNFQFKLSYHASNQPKNEPTFIKDYAGMTFWLSYNLYTILPKKLRTHYPKWLNLAVGYSVSRQTHGDVEIYLAPDVNWNFIPLGKSETAKFFQRALNYIHFPCFTLKLTPEKKFYPIYF